MEMEWVKYCLKLGIVRCAQPLVGLKGSRSIQDEKLVEAVFCSNGGGEFFDHFKVIYIVKNIVI
jgi:Myotubularin-like phosphatase domain